MLDLEIESKIKRMILKRTSKEDIIKEITREYGKIQELKVWYDCCYNTVCKELGINRKKGEELKPKRSKPKRKQGK